MVDVRNGGGGSSSTGTSNVRDTRRVSWAAVFGFATFLFVLLVLMGSGEQIACSDALGVVFLRAISLTAAVFGVIRTRKSGNQLKGAWMAWTAAVGSALTILYFLLAFVALAGSGR
jgi:hypothetical protein